MGRLPRGMFRLAVAGNDMAPTLRSGDRLLVVRHGRLPRVGDLVVALDPLSAPDLIVQRLVGIDEGMCRLASDAAPPGQNDRAVLLRDIVGIPVLRYAPLARLGRLPATP